MPDAADEPRSSTTHYRAGAYALATRSQRIGPRKGGDFLRAGQTTRPNFTGGDMGQVIDAEFRFKTFERWLDDWLEISRELLDEEPPQKVAGYGAAQGPMKTIAVAFPANDSRAWTAHPDQGPPCPAKPPLDDPKRG